MAREGLPAPASALPHASGSADDPEVGMATPPSFTVVAH
jgi:hypothetical protein